jgi:hypothetical protein
MEAIRSKLSEKLRFWRLGLGCRSIPFDRVKHDLELLDFSHSPITVEDGPDCQFLSCYNLFTTPSTPTFALPTAADSG